MEDSDASRVHRLRIAYASAINRVTPERGQSRGDGAHTRTSAAHCLCLSYRGSGVAVPSSRTRDQHRYRPTAISPVAVPTRARAGASSASYRAAPPLVAMNLRGAVRARTAEYRLPIARSCMFCA